VTWTASYATTTADTFGTLASPTVTQIATGTFTVSATVTNFSANISVPAAATTGIQIVFTVGALTAGLTWTIGNVQFEKGSTATTFDYRPFGTELALCQRYYETSRGTASTFTQSTTIAYPVFVTDTGRTSGRQFVVSKRSAPIVTIYSRNNTSGKVSTVAAGTDNAGTASASSISETGWSNTIIGTATTAGVGIEVAYAAESEL